MKIHVDVVVEPKAAIAEANFEYYLVAILVP
jgi:hypothetical protein